MLKQFKEIFKCISELEEQFPENKFSAFMRL